MQVVRIIFPVALLLALESCKPLSSGVTSQDCIVPAAPAGFTRIFIGNPARGGQGSGTSFDDPLDGSTAEKFDAILRSIADGQHPTWGTQANIAPQNLIVCVARGTFQTNGQYDWNIIKGHTLGSNLGFTAEKNWKIHGRGVNQTKLQLASYAPHQFVDANGAPVQGGNNVVVGTHSKFASGIEISDLTIDANHDALTSPGGVPLNLEGISLRSNEGGHWIHDVNVTGASGDVGVINIKSETFTVQIWGNQGTFDPQQNINNIIEHVNVGNPGLPVAGGAPPGGIADGIVVNNAVAEVRNNVVEGYTLGYGGWSMGPVWFHDNIARNTKYGFNADSLNNAGVILQSNQIIHPISYGIVIGGGDGVSVFKDWNVLNNTIQLDHSGSIALVLRGQVQNATISGNTIAADGPSATNQTAIWSYPAISGLMNVGISFQDNRIDKRMNFNFDQDPNFASDCRFQNRDLQGQPRPDFPDNSSAKCR